MAEQSTVLSRMIEELAGLEERFSKLDAFILSEHFEKLPQEDRLDLCSQYQFMAGYLKVLKLRVNKMMGVTIDV